jgi:hypothetical protein
MKGKKMDFMTKITETTNAINAAKEAYSNALKEAVDPTLNQISKEYGDQLDILTIVGYTPGFNDGEPCTHGSDWGFGYSFLQDYGLEDSMEEWFEDEEGEIQEELIEELLNKKVDVPKEVNEFVSKVLDPYFEEKLETDYRVTIFFENGTYRIEEDEYDCGY